GSNDTHVQEMKPQEVGEDRATQHEEGEGAEQSRARDDVTDICEGGGERQKRKAPRKILDAVANPETSLGRKQLEQDGAGGDRGERCQREQHALEMIGADSKAMPDDESDAGYTKQQAERLAPGHDLAEEH